jgi:hypothetical protein
MRQDDVITKWKWFEKWHGYGVCTLSVKPIQSELSAGLIDCLIQFLLYDRLWHVNIIIYTHKFD